MEVFSKAFPKTLSGLVIGVGVALAAPVLLVAAASLLQPLAKTALKGGFIMRDTALGLYGATGARLAEALQPASGRIPRGGRTQILSLSLRACPPKIVSPLVWDGVYSIRHKIHRKFTGLSLFPLGAGAIISLHDIHEP